MKMRISAFAYYFFFYFYFFGKVKDFCVANNTKAFVF